MKDSLSVGSSPAGEDCVQLGCENYRELSRKECNRFIAGIRKYLGEEPRGARLFIKSNPHDFGTYSEVECEFDSDNEEAVNYAYKCEGNLPESWEELEGEYIIQGQKKQEEESKEKEG